MIQLKRIVFIAVDLQNEFASKGGSHFVLRPSVGFVKDVLIGFLRKKGIRTAEIISDYRQPRPGDPRDICRPGEWGYESIIPRDIVKNDVWVKCMNPPIWVRDNIGDPEKEPGIPYQDPKRFDSWLSENVGSPGDTDNIVLFGLTLDRCVLCVA